MQRNDKFEPNIMTDNTNDDDNDDDNNNNNY